MNCRALSAFLLISSFGLFGCSLDVSVEDLDGNNFSASTIQAIGPFVADSITPATIKIYVMNKGAPVVGFTPIYKVSGSGNLLGQCSETDATGLSTCLLRSSVAETKKITLTNPATNASIEVTFSPGLPAKAGFSLSSGGGLQSAAGLYRSTSSIGLVTSPVVLEEDGVPGTPRARVGLQGVLFED